MSMPLRIADEILVPARQEADASDRTLASQVEHWAKLGMAIERVLGREYALSLKRRGLAVDLNEALSHASSSAGQEQALAALKTSKVRYSADPSRPGRMVRISSDGSRTTGRFVKRTFVADKPRRK